MGKEITVEQVQELMDFMTEGKEPEGWSIAKTNKPKLSHKKAFSIIYLLQELLQIVPDRFEMCKYCGQIFDTYCEGVYLDDQYEEVVYAEDAGGNMVVEGKRLKKQYWGHYCDSCVPVAFRLKGRGK